MSCKDIYYIESLASIIDIIIISFHGKEGHLPFIFSLSIIFRLGWVSLLSANMIDVIIDIIFLSLFYWSLSFRCVIFISLLIIIFFFHYARHLFMLDYAISDAISHLSSLVSLLSFITVINIITLMPNITTLLIGHFTPLSAFRHSSSLPSSLHQYWLMDYAYATPLRFIIDTLRCCYAILSLSIIDCWLRHYWLLRLASLRFSFHAISSFSFILIFPAATPFHYFASDYHWWFIISSSLSLMPLRLRQHVISLPLLFFIFIISFHWLIPFAFTTSFVIIVITWLISTLAIFIDIFTHFIYCHHFFPYHHRLSLSLLFTFLIIFIWCFFNITGLSLITFMPLRYHIFLLITLRFHYYYAIIISCRYYLFSPLMLPPHFHWWLLIRRFSLFFFLSFDYITPLISLIASTPLRHLIICFHAMYWVSDILIRHHYLNIIVLHINIIINIIGHYEI